MARKPAPDTRERILEAATQLFYRHGVNAVGMNQIIDACGCGKSLLYREFASKDELVVEYLQRCFQDWTATMDEATRGVAGDPAAELLAMVGAVAGQVSHPDYRGCPFLNATGEFPATHPVRRVSADHRGFLRSRLRDLAARAAAEDPDTLSDRLLLIIDGMYANAAILGPDGAAASAAAFAGDVIAAATGRQATLQLI
jgi:AcrR family transcriptional regulator